MLISILDEKIHITISVNTLKISEHSFMITHPIEVRYEY